jgi:hypothetical protein
MTKTSTIGVCRLSGLAAAVVLLLAPAAANGDVLYDQTSNPAAFGSNVTSQDFFTPDNALDAQAADDFTVPPGQLWGINELDVVGDVSNTPPTDVNVFIYANAGTLPGAQLFGQIGIATTGSPDFVIPLTGVPALGPGTYWVSVQVDGGTATNQWFWRDIIALTGNKASWQNPGDGFASGCTTWAVREVCLPVTSAPDQVFKLQGNPDVTPPVAPPSNSIVLGKPVRNRTTGTAILPVNVPGPGTLALSGDDVKTQRPQRKAPAQTATAVTTAGIVNLKIAAKGASRAKLRRRGKLKVQVTITYTPTGGSVNAQTKTIKLKRNL